jgi:hypothetical protein
MNAPFPHTATEAFAAKPRTVLLLANEFVSQYRVLRCAAMTGARVHVMGPDKARSLALSRFCAAYHPYSFGNEAYLGGNADLDPKNVAAKIDQIAHEHGIDMVLPSDALTTRLLSTMQPHLATRSFPVPDVATFDALATKDAFMAFCHARNLLHPQGQVFATVDELRDAVAEKRVRFPAMFKPVNRAGSIGVVRVDESNVQDLLARIDYAPILAQDFIAGEDRCITVTAVNGSVVKEVIYWHPDGVFHFRREPEISRIIANIVRELDLTGVFNFDARIGTDGRVWMIECNPRFFFNMDVTAVAGMNFVALDDIVPGVPVSLEHGDMRVPQSSARELAHGHWPTSDDRKMLKHWLADPLVFALVSTGFPRAWRSQMLERVAARLRAA